MTDEKKEPGVISMPLSYWEYTAGYWKIKPEWLKAAPSRGGIIAKMQDGTILKIGNESAKP